MLVKVYIQDLGKSKQDIKCITIHSALIVLNHDPNQPPRDINANRRRGVRRRGDITAPLTVNDCPGELKHQEVFLKGVHSVLARLYQMMKHFSWNTARGEQREAKR